MRHLFALTILCAFALITSSAHAGFNDYKKVKYKNPDYIKAKEDPTYIENDFGKFYAYLGGPRGLVLCFHDNGGKAMDWSKGAKKDYLEFFQDKGYSFICPSAEGETWKGADIKAMDTLLDELQILSYRSLYLVGYATGGDFASRFAASSKRRHKVKAIHFANSAGQISALSGTELEYEAFFSYARCDKTIDFKQIQEGIKAVRESSKAREHILDTQYFMSFDRNCTSFLNTAKPFYRFIK